MYRVTKYCRMCLNKKIKVGLRLSQMPLGERYTFNKKSALRSKKFPLTIGWCSRCKNIQTMEVVSPKMLWGDFTYISGQTNSIVEHFKQISVMITRKFKLRKNDFVIDIGSNDGSLLKFFKNKNFRVLGIDPADKIANIANKRGIKTLVSFFNLKIARKIKKNYPKAKIITCFNTFAHAENMREIMFGVKEIIDENGVFVFECQYLNDIYKKKILGTFFHEHMYHHSVTSLYNFFKSFDLDLFHVQKTNIQKGSIIGFVCKKNKFKISNDVRNFLKLEKKNGDNQFSKLTNFQKYILMQKKKSQSILKKFNKKIIGGYGAARSGPTLALNFGVAKYLRMLFDDHSLKKNKYTPLRGLFVHPTKKVLKYKPDVMVVLAYLHLKKILKKNIRYISNGGKFLSLYPEVILINKKNYKKFI